MMVYLAGPMRGYPEFNFPLFFEVEEALKQQQGWEVLSPARMDRQLGFDPKNLKGTEQELAFLGFDLGDAMRRDLNAITQCDGICLLPGWEKSRGARVEAQVANEINLAFYEWDPVLRRPRPFVYGQAPQSEETKQTILDEAKMLVHGPRQESYGHPIDDFTRTASIMSAILGHEVRAEQVPLLMIAVKLSRECHRPKRDNVVDLAGYAATLELVRDKIGGW